MNTKKYNITLSALDRAVVAQLGGTCSNIAGDRCEIDEDTAQRLADVCRCSCGAAGGFSGFIYYSETRDFTANNRAEIVARLREQIDEGLFEGSRGVVSAVLSFSCFKGEDPDELEDEAARVLFGSLDDVRSGELDRVANALAWGALEDLAFKLDGQESDDESGDDPDNIDAEEEETDDNGEGVRHV